jgi:hypothetical protein
VSHSWALAKSISNWHLIGYNEGYCSNTGYIHQEDKPFITGRIKTLIVNRDKAFAKGDKQKFTSLRNKVRDEIKKEKQKFYRVKVKPLQSNNPKDWWKSIKRICGIGKNQKINLVNPE